MASTDSSPRAPRLLLISYLFPPAGGIAVQRMLSVARYLPDLGFQVHVLSASNPGVPTLDEKLLDSIPRQVRVTRVWSPEVPFALRQALWRMAGKKPGSTAGEPDPGQPPRSSFWKSVARRVFSPDPEVVWVPFARRAARRIVREQKIDVVVVSAPPFSSFMVGNALKEEFPSIRLVSDFRDEWLDFYLNTFEFYRHDSIRAKARVIEQETVRRSDLVLSITGSCVKRIRGRYPDLPESRFRCLPNGFDPAAFEGFQARPHGGPRIRVAHVGTVYPTSTPRYYLDALESLEPGQRDVFETHFVGRITDQERPYLQGRSAHIVERGFVPQAEAIREMEQADVLLLNMTDPNFASGKIFDYLATGKPILAISPTGGEVDEVIRNTGAGWLADPSDPAALRRILLEIIERARSGSLAGASLPEKVREFSRPVLARRMASELQALLSAPGVK
ncbi:MAG: glycosyltransferase [Acidobacteria bacterium]|nr:glycosyltransferase [Acidobacteriota bacterium]